MKETFVVNIMYDQNATWQGSVDWLGESGKKSQYFRSALELFRLIDSAMDREERREWRIVSD